MRPLYEQLLNAAISRLEDLQATGARYVPVKSDALQLLPTTPGATASQRASAPTSVSSRISHGLPPGVIGKQNDPVAHGTSPSAGIPSQNIAAANLAGPNAVSSQTESPFKAALPPQEKNEAMQQLRERALVCMKCPHLASSRKNVVFGVGDVNSPLMFVGEGPGADEDAQGEPFVGRAGQLLTRIIQTMGLERSQVYIGNVLKCRPDTPGQAYGNRKPTPEEMKTCLPYLVSQIEIIRPRVIVALGATAVEGLLGMTSAGITRLRGHWQDFRGIAVMPTFHPSFLLRPENAAKKRLVWEDMLAVMERLAMPISEKQRGYFLKVQ